MKTPPQNNSKARRKAPKNKKKTGLTDFDNIKLSSKPNSKNPKSKTKKKGQKKITKFNAKK